MLSKEEIDEMWKMVASRCYVDISEYDQMKKKAEELAEENARLKQNKAYTESPLQMLTDYLKRIDELESKVAKLEFEIEKMRSVVYPQWLGGRYEIRQ